jgi:hypothetical protein
VDSVTVLALIAAALLTFSPTVVRIIVSLLIPIVTGFVTKLSAPAKVKATVAFVLSGVGALVTLATTGDGGLILTSKLLSEWGLTFVFQLAAYLGLLGPVADINTRTAPDKGLG